MLLAQLLQVYEFAVKEVLIHRVPLLDGGISPQKKKRKHRYVAAPTRTHIFFPSGSHSFAKSSNNLDLQDISVTVSVPGNLSATKSF